MTFAARLALAAGCLIMLARWRAPFACAAAYAGVLFAWAFRGGLVGDEVIVYVIMRFAAGAACFWILERLPRRAMRIAAAPVTALLLALI